MAGRETFAALKSIDFGNHEKVIIFLKEQQEMTKKMQK